MMYTSGDIRNPLRETSEIIEDIVKSQVIEVCKRATYITQIRGSRSMSVEDIAFITRKDLAKLGRIKEYLGWKDVRKNVKSAEADDVIEDEKIARSQRKQSIMPWEYFEQLGNSGMSTAVENVVSQENLHRMQKANEMTIGMAKDEYIEYSECRQASFTYKKTKKFKDWISFSQFMDFKPNEDVIDILGFIACEIVSTVTEKALEIKNELLSDEKKVTGILPLHVHEAYRRLSQRNHPLWNFRSGLNKKSSILF